MSYTVLWCWVWEGYFGEWDGRVEGEMRGGEMAEELMWEEWT